MFTIENLKNRLINHSVALKYTFDENGTPRQGALIADKDGEFLNMYLNRPEWNGATIELCYKESVIKYLTENNIKYEFNSEIEKINNIECVYFSIYISPYDAKKLVAFLDKLHR